MGDESVVKYDEMGVMDGGTIGLARGSRKKPSKPGARKELFPEVPCTRSWN